MRHHLVNAAFVAVVASALAGGLAACEEKTQAAAQPAAAEPAKPSAPAPAPEFHAPADPKNIVSIAGGSKDHTTLVKALAAADYVDSLANPGPFTVFAPTNAAFDALPKGTLEELTKPAKAEDLRNILKYHVTVSTYAAATFQEGQVLGMANGAKVTMHVKDGKVRANDATILASIPASNGIVHVVDKVLLPPSH